MTFISVVMSVIISVNMSVIMSVSMSAHFVESLQGVDSAEYLHHLLD